MVNPSQERACYWDPWGLDWGNNHSSPCQQDILEHIDGGTSHREKCKEIHTKVQRERAMENCSQSYCWSRLIF